MRWTARAVGSAAALLGATVTLLGAVGAAPAGAAGTAVRPVATSVGRSATATSNGPGYWLMTGWGSSYAFNVAYLGSPESHGSDVCVNQGGPTVPPYACVGLAALAGGQGYFIASGPADAVSQPRTVTYDGLLGAEGNVTTACPNGTPTEVTPLTAPVVGVASAGATGAWLAAADGGVFALCGASFHGSMGGTRLDQPVVDIAATPDGGGYWLVARDGGVFSFGDARFDGSMGGEVLDAPVTGMAANPDGTG
ncbi:MAG: hypothetical protein ACYCVC_04795 [Acidimicrobiales bacterium]